MKTSMSNTLKILSLDMISAANSGHPGVAMGLSDALVALLFRLRFNPSDPLWINRDRLVFSGGHASALIYSFLFLCGYEFCLDDLKKFRSLDSKTPGHPEFAQKLGIEMTTGPLGQGVANAVGLAMASLRAKEMLGDLITHKVYCFCGEGDLEEGISYESCSLAGLHRLNNLILIYDSNEISIEGSTKIAFDEDIKSRFLAQGWEVLSVNGHDFDALDLVLTKAQDAQKPTLIISKTNIARGALELEGSEKSHGAPFSADLVARIKESLGFDKNKSFELSESVKLAFSACVESAKIHYKIWEKKYQDSPKKELLDELKNPDFSKIKFPRFDKSLATRASNGEILNAISAELKGFVGGSADLAPSNNTRLKNSADFPQGSNLHFGIREHAMGAICNAFATYGIFLPFCATFFVFSDYMSAPVRLAALSGLKAFFIWTHDSIGVGEDGATHQPIEQLSHFRAMPNLFVFRPADGNENVACWKIALNAQNPSAFVLSRQNLEIVTKDISSDDLCAKIARGAYILADSENPQITLIASGSEVSLALKAFEELKRENIDVRVVSAPCYDLLIAQDKEFLDSMFVGKTIAIEASRGFEWYRFADVVVNMDTFGKSAKGDALFSHFGFSVENIVNLAKEV